MRRGRIDVVVHQSRLLAGNPLGDPSERELPDIGLARFVDPETGETFEIDTSSPRVRADFEKQVTVQREARKHLLRRLAIDEVPVRTDGNYIEPLLKFFRSRETQVGRR